MSPDPRSETWPRSAAIGPITYGSRMWGDRLQLTHPVALGAAARAVTAVVYPLVADSAQQPLALFVFPILIGASLGTWRQALVVGTAAAAVALIEGVLLPQLDAAGLIIRMLIITVSAAVGVAVALQRERRQSVVDEAKTRTAVIDLFQDSLVPAPLPPPGVEVDTRYKPGDERLQLGGDFFDAIRLPNGNLGYVIGDVCGQGPRAAAFGAAVRAGWKTLAHASPTDPLVWVNTLDAAFFRLGRHTDTYVTLNTGVLTPSTGHMLFVSAGHPWPVLVADDVLTVEPRVGPPLGLTVGAPGNWQSTAFTLPRHATLLLYTDGLIENQARGSRGVDGAAQLLRYLRRQLPREQLDLDHLLDEFGPRGFHDDVAIMAMRRS